MTKLKFLLSLQEKLSGFPQDEVEERLNFYSEMIEDRMEEGLSEEEAVAKLGPVDQVVSQIAAEIPLIKIAKKKITTKRRLKWWEILLLALGSPVWLSLMIAVFAVVFALYISLWTVIVSLWACFGALVGCAFGGIAAGIGIICQSNVPSGVAMIGAALVCAGLSIFWFYGCKSATKGILILSKKTVIWIKKCFVKKETAQ